MVKLRVGLSMLYTLSEPFSKMIEQLSELDETFVEIVDEGTHKLNKKRVDKLKKIAEKKDILYSVHAPFADINPASPSRPILKTSMKQLKKSIKNSVELNAYLWVFHPGSKSGISSFYPEKDWKQNIQSIQELHALAENFGLQIAMENLPKKYNFLMNGPEDFARFYEETGLRNIGVVLDTGHANLDMQIQPFVDQLHKEIVHIHISDNNGETDEHLGLGYGKIDWQHFVKTIEATDFSGTVLTESVFNVRETLQKLRQLFS